MIKLERGTAMAPTDAQKKASLKYQSENIASLVCRVKKEQAEKFKTYCAEHGKTTNAVLREYVLECIGEPEIQGGRIMLTDAQIVARLRGRFRKFNLKIHKLKEKDYCGNVLYQVLDIDDDPKDHEEDEYGIFKLDKLLDYASELEEKYAEYKYLQREGK